MRQDFGSGRQLRDAANAYPQVSLRLGPSARQPTRMSSENELSLRGDLRRDPLTGLGKRISSMVHD
jgi:hypothetical protein